jgi:hypothetical protein
MRGTTYFAGAASAGLSAAGAAAAGLVLFLVELFLVVVVPFLVLLDAVVLVSDEAGGVAGFASWAKAAKDVARTSALMRFFMVGKLLGVLGWRG